jgi:uncharacterized protein YydD (DUF2326 family)
MDGIVLRERIRKLREEIAEIRKQGEDYSQFHQHSKLDIEKHKVGFQRLTVILRELLDLMKERGEG